MKNLAMVLRRDRNHHHSTFEIDADGRLKEVKHAFDCDDCGQLPASYGCIERPGAWLRCAACNLKAALMNRGV